MERKFKEKKKLKNEEGEKIRKTSKSEIGITLIALVITIVVLLILAGVSIAMLTGDNGILSQASQAKIETDRAKTIEEAQLTYNEVAIEKRGDISDEKSINELVFQKMQERGNDIRDKVVSTEKITQIKFVDGSGNNISEKVSINVDETKNDIYITYNSEASTTTEKYIKVRDLYYAITLNKGKATLGNTGYKLEDIQSTTTQDEIEIEYDGQYVTASISDIENDKTKDRLVLTGKAETSNPINITVKSKLQAVSAQLNVEVIKKKDYISKVIISTNEEFKNSGVPITYSCEIIEGTEGDLTWELAEGTYGFSINQISNTKAEIAANQNGINSKIIIKNEENVIVGEYDIQCIVNCPTCKGSGKCPYCDGTGNNWSWYCYTCNRLTNEQNQTCIECNTSNGVFCCSGITQPDFNGVCEVCGGIGLDMFF